MENGTIKNPQSVIDERFDAIYAAQEEIAADRNLGLIGETLEVLVEGLHEESDLLFKGRFYGQAPDIDGCVIINDTADKLISSGDVVKVKITDRFSYDLVGELVTN